MSNRKLVCFDVSHEIILMHSMANLKIDLFPFTLNKMFGVHYLEESALLTS